MIVTEGDTIIHSRLITAHNSDDGGLENAVRAQEHKVLTSNMLKATCPCLCHILRVHIPDDLPGQMGAMHQFRDFTGNFKAWCRVCVGPVEGEFAPNRKQFLSPWLNCKFKSKHKLQLAVFNITCQRTVRVCDTTQK